MTTCATSTHISTLAAMTEPDGTAIVLVVFGLLVALCVLFSRSIDRLGIPVVLLFIALGVLGGSEGLGGLAFDNYAMAVRLGTIALVLVLFDGGLNTKISDVRSVLAPASVLATLGVVLTAGFMTLAGKFLGLSWTEALVLGAVVSSTDAAAVFAVLRGGSLQLQPRVGRTIEVESCVNDPMAVILTVTIIQMLTTDTGSWQIALLAVPVQLAVGAIVGALFGWLGRLLLTHVHIQTVGLYPLLTMALAFLSFGAATLAWGSGFLAVFVTGLVLNAGNLPHRNGLARVHDAFAWLSQVAMFLMLGMLVFPSQLLPVAWIGLVLALILAFIARPLAVLICLLPFRLPKHEVAYVGWIGLRGAVPIILATFPVLAEVPGAMHVFNIVFFIVVVSALIPGTTIRYVTRWLNLNVPDRPQPSAILEINSTHPLNSELVSFLIDPSVAACGAHLRDVEFPEGAAVSLIIRNGDLIVPRGNTQFLPGDHVYVFFKPQDRAMMELIFGGLETG